jgi:transposase
VPPASHPERGALRLRQTVWSARRLARKLARVAVASGAAVEPQLREAPVMNEGSWVGLDVHARSVVAGVIDQGSGELRSLRVPPGNEGTVAWLKTLPAPVRVVYEAGPTGYGLARACAAAGINCVVAAPSRIRPAADRVKTDRRDAERLARLLRLGEITPVRVPEPEEEAARDLVRGRRTHRCG